MVQCYLYVWGHHVEQQPEAPVQLAVWGRCVREVGERALTLWGPMTQKNAHTQ